MPRKKEDNEILQNQIKFTTRLLEEMFPLTNRTFVGVMSGKMHKTFSVKYIIEHMDLFVGKKSVYFTGNIIIPRTRRCQRNVSVLNDIYLDLDTNHDRNSRFLNPTSAYWEVKTLIREKGIPNPSLVLNTTRGLQLHWFIDPMKVTKKRIELWKGIESAFSTAFGSFCSDGAVAKDYARLLRFPYSVNEKTNEIVDVLDYDGERYPIGVLMNCANNLSKKETKAGAGVRTASAKQLKYVRDICRALNLEIPDVSSYQGADQFIKEHKDQLTKENVKSSFYLKKRFSCPKKGEPYNVELEKLNAQAIERFVEDHPQNDHCRESLMFLYRLAQMHITEDKNAAWAMVVSLNNKYADPFPMEKLNQLTESAVRYFEKGDLRWYGPKAIESKVVGNNSGISILPYFAFHKQDSGNSKRNKSEYNKLYYEKQLADHNKEKKSLKIEKRRAVVREMRMAGYDYASIAEKLGVSVKTIQRDMLSFSCRAVDKNSDPNLLKKYTFGISPYEDSSSLSAKELSPAADWDDEDAEDMVILSELQNKKEKEKQNSNNDENNTNNKNKKEQRYGVYPGDVVKAFQELVGFVNKEVDCNSKEYERTPNAIYLIDRALFAYENIDVLNYKSRKNSCFKEEQVGEFGRVVVFLSRERKLFKKELLLYLNSVLFNNNDNKNDNANNKEVDLEELKKAVYSFVMQRKKLKKIGDYYVKKRVVTECQRMNAAVVYRQRANLKKLSLLREKTRDYAIVDAVDKFFYWYSNLKQAGKDETFALCGNEINKNAFSKAMFFNASELTIENVAKKIKCGCKLEEILLSFVQKYSF